MKNLLFHILLLLTMASCHEQVTKEPVWANATDTLVMPDFRIEFAADKEDWQAVLYTSSQPVKLSARFAEGKLVVSPQQHSGITEGPAELCLSTARENFFYTVHLINEDPGTIVNLEHRSPKAVIADFSLDQQRIIHRIDAWRNLQMLERGGYFFEEETVLTSAAGVYQADSNNALTAYYVHPGSCISVPLRSVYREQTDSFQVTAGPLKDKYNNTLADGTLVTFIYNAAGQTWHREAALLDGLASVTLPARSNTNTAIKAVVNEIDSKTIKLIKQ
jgi:hypothetical protein